MGAGDILQTGKIVLLATGSQKAAVLKKLLTGAAVTTQVPCTPLKLHWDVTVILDQELARQIGASS
ncbi:hypothetical protein [Propionispora vibrioides]|uniref:Glucosamine-6-phosphate deaminase n=1 Tax=Propionispora vibrioides TaxID=112903 RepID=A0A1H8XMI1_9FIRM|nr:hypothetical protein [Propionispora vibrioides]SEP40981.1 glucosamine-6-phosphate deaminase [Propionispora vibrioides]